MQMSRLKLSYGKRLYFFHALTTLYLCFIYTLSMLYLYTIPSKIGGRPHPQPFSGGEGRCSIEDSFFGGRLMPRAFDSAYVKIEV